MVSMDDTTTANSSSAAAVADGASAAAHTKTVGAAPVKSASHVKLLIKSSNQQYEDHVIESDLLWTVKRLKTHLSMVYPSKPPAADQKLIYSGQLLSDNLQLKDVIRSYKDVYTHNHIIHLVYTPKNLPPTTNSNANKTKSSTNLNSATANGVGGGGGGSNSSSTTNNMSSSDGLRQRHTAGNNTNNNDSNQQSSNANMQQQQQQQSPLFHQQMHPYFMTPQLMSMAAMSCPQFPQNLAAGFGGGAYNVQALLTQQTAMYNWMQQVYSQYMEQCLRLSNNVSSSSATGNNSYPAAFPTVPPNFQHLFQQQFPSTVMTPQVAVDSTATSAAAAANNTAAAAAERQDQQQQQQPAQAQVAAGRFPNLPQDDQENRDWLDNFFSITRLALFLTLLYFNSSPLRCLVVVIIAGGIYLYHIGVFRLRHERNNNNLNRNNNAAQNAAVDQIRQGVDQQQNAAAAPEGQANNENNAAEGEQQQPTSQQTETSTPDAPDNANNESMMSTIRTFVVTFFTSLLPETPAL